MIFMKNANCIPEACHGVNERIIVWDLLMLEEVFGEEKIIERL